MLSGERFLTKGRGKEEENMCQLHLIVSYSLQFRIPRVSLELYRAYENFAVPSEDHLGNYK